MTFSHFEIHIFKNFLKFFTYFFSLHLLSGLPLFSHLNLLLRSPLTLKIPPLPDLLYLPKKRQLPTPSSLPSQVASWQVDEMVNVAKHRDKMSVEYKRIMALTTSLAGRTLRRLVM